MDLNDVQDFCSNCLQNLFSFLAFKFLSESLQPFPRALGIAVESEKSKTVVTYLRAILRMRVATLPRAEIFFWHAVLTATACPTATHPDSASATDSAVGVARFPGSSSEIGFGLGYFARDTRFLDLAGQTHSIEAALSLSVLHRKIVFHVPLLAHVTLPRRSNICVVLGTFSAHPVCFVSFPLSGGESTILSAFTAD
jgi:hypothetical protein